jgi:hypothetical protein
MKGPLQFIISSAHHDGGPVLRAVCGTQLQMLRCISTFGAECLCGLVAGGKKQAGFIIVSVNTNVESSGRTGHTGSNVLDACKREYVRDALEEARGDIGRALDVGLLAADIMCIA